MAASCNFVWVDVNKNYQSALRSPNQNSSFLQTTQSSSVGLPLSFWGTNIKNNKRRNEKEYDVHVESIHPLQKIELGKNNLIYTTLDLTS